MKRIALIVLLMLLAKPLFGQSVTLSVEPSGAYFATYRSASGSAQSSRDVVVTSDSPACQVVPRPGARGRYGTVMAGSVTPGTRLRCSITATARVGGASYRSVSTRIEVHEITAWALRILPRVVAVVLCPGDAHIAASDTVRTIQFTASAALADGSMTREGITYGTDLGTIDSTGLWRAPPAAADTARGNVWAEAGGVRSQRGSCR